MFIIGLTVLFFALSLCAPRIVAASDDSTAAPVNKTDNVWELTVHHHTRDDKKWIPKLAETQDYLLSTHQNRFYLVNVIVDGQLLRLSVQTGSNATWVASSNFICLDPPCNFGPSFNPTEARLDVWKPNARRIGPGSQFIEGKIVRQEISLGGLNTEQMPYLRFKQHLMLAEKGYWKGDGISAGVLGLAYPSSHTRLSFLTTLFQDVLRPPVFSLALNRYSESAPNLGGILAFGGVPDIPTQNRWRSTRILEPVAEVYAPRIRVDGFRIVRPGSGVHRRGGGISNYLDCPMNMEILSGTPEIHLPAEIVAYTAGLFIPAGQYDPAQNLYFMPCDARAPAFAVRIKKRPFFISTKDLLEPAPEYGENFCKLQLLPVSDSHGRLILGDAWLKTVVVVFDYTRVREKNPPHYGFVRIDGRDD